ncbi:recombinase family protein [Phocea massiliensis]|uniref:Recombinase family protein n=1 Tax=Merdimmobilis hominis TaxID=2897707 RepID=A0A938X900_9FIRM|nr:recombinase family protein [Merdimmobilis hominis]MBM6921704.1 recombinase family protein [Merdimmobilis hominis]
MSTQAVTMPKAVRVIPAKPEYSGKSNADFRPKRVAAYCRVSTDKEEQEHSFETQKEMYTDMIMMKPNWQMAGIYADEGITGTIAKKRPDFMRMIEDCRKGKIDMVITKSVSRFSRNNLDCLQYVRELKERGIPILFEKEGINTLQVSSELLITLFSGLSQAESESISMNVKIGKRQSIKNGNVPFCYSSFLGYRKGADGKPEIVPEEAEIIKRIYAEYLAGTSLIDIAKGLMRDGILTPKGKTNWTTKGVLSILTNEKYKGDALLQKTYIVDCISKKSKKNTGELPMYYVENNHPAIIERAVFDRVQEEVSRRNSKRKVKDVGTKTELGKYSSKYALTELLFCGNCGTPYRRTTWAKNGKKKIVWRCISRLDYGTKYCKNSPSIEEGVLQNAIAAAITRKAQTEGANIQRIREHIEMYLNRKDNSDLEEKQERLVSLRQRIDELTSMDSESAQNGDFDELFESLYTEMYAIKDELEDAEKTNAKLDTAVNQIDEMTTVMYGLKNHPVEYNEQIVRQLISSIKVVSAEQILILFKDGTEITADL